MYALLLSQIIDAGALPVFLKILNDNHPEDQVITARAIWSLSFDDGVCQQIKEFPNMKQKLEDLKSSKDEEIAENVNGTLYVFRKGSLFFRM